MTHRTPAELDEDTLLRHFEALVRDDRSLTASMLRYIAEIDRRNLYLKHACPTMSAFCVERFHMSEGPISAFALAARPVTSPAFLRCSKEDNFT